MEFQELELPDYVETRGRYGLLASFVGFTLVIGSSYAAFLYEFAHYYEPMLAGLILVLLPFTPRTLLDKETLLPLYVMFLLAGLIFDGLIVPNVVQLWSYGYTSHVEFVPLYAWIYPAGGFVMLQSFIVLDRIFDAPASASLPVTWPIGAAAIGSSVGTAVAIVFSFHPIVVFGGFVLIGFFTREYVAQRRTGTSLLGKVYAAPVRVTSIILSVAVVNALLHEAPNTVAGQWIYHDIPFSTVALFGVPILVIFGWVFLVLAPVSWYYSDPLDIVRGRSD